MIDNRTFRETVGKFTTGITIVTVENEGEIQGMTVNAFMSVSLDPKLIAVSIGDQAQMYETLQNENKFGVSILKEEQQDLSMIFAKQKGKDRDIQYIEQNGVPVLKDSLASLTCTVQKKVHAGDHIIFIAEVTDLNVNEGNPLLYVNGNYGTLD